MVEDPCLVGSHSAGGDIIHWQMYTTHHSLCHRYNWHLHAGGWQQQQSVCHVLWKIRERSKPCTSWEVCINCLPNACECSSINGTYYASNYGIMYSSCWSNLDVVLRLKPAPPGTASRTAVCTARFGSPPFGNHGSILWLYAKMKSLSFSLDTGECLWGGKCQADCKDTIDRTVVTAKGSVRSQPFNPYWCIILLVQCFSNRNSYAWGNMRLQLPDW